MIIFPPGLMGGVGKALYEFRSTQRTSLDQTLYTFTGFSVSAADVGKLALVTATAFVNGTGVLPTNVTFSGVSLTLLAGTPVNNIMDSSAAMYAGVIPANPTGTITVSYPAAQACAVSFGVVTGGKLPASDSNGISPGSVASTSTSLTSKAGGLALALGLRRTVAAGGTITGAAAFTEVAEDFAETNRGQYTFAVRENVISRTGETVTYTPSAPTNIAIAAAALDAVEGAPAELVAPAFAEPTSSTLAGRIVTLALGSASGVPAPSLAVTALTLNGVDALGDLAGLDYTVPSSVSAQTVAWTVTATNSAGSATSQGSRAVAANLAAPAFTTPPSITPASGPTGTVFTLDEGIASGSPAPTLAGVLTLNGADVTPAGLSYTATAEGELIWTVTASNGVAPDAVAQDLATVAGVGATVVAPTATAINAALAAAAPGDIIEVQAGTVTGVINMPQVTMSPPVTLRAQGATSVKIGPTNVSGPKLSVRPVWLQNGIVWNAARGFAVEGFRISRDGSTGTSLKIFQTTTGYSGLTMRNCEVFDAQTNGIQGAITRSKFRISDGLPPTGSELPSEVAAFAVESRSAWAFGRNPFSVTNASDDVVIEDCWFHDTNTPAFWAHNFTYRGNYAEDIYTGAIPFGVVRDLDGNFNFTDNVWEDYWNGQTDRVLDWPSTGLLHGALGGLLNTNNVERVQNVTVKGNIVRHGTARFAFDGDQTGITGFKINDVAAVGSVQNLVFEDNIYELGSNTAFQIAGTTGAIIRRNTFLRGAGWTASGFVGVAAVNILSSGDNLDNANVRFEANITEANTVSIPRTTGTNGPTDQLNWVDNIIINAAFDEAGAGVLSRGAADYLVSYGPGQTAQALHDGWRPKPGTRGAALGVGAFGGGYVIGSGGEPVAPAKPVPAAAAATAWTPARVTYPGTMGWRSVANTGLSSASATVIASFKSGGLGTQRRIFGTAGGTISISRHPTFNRYQIFVEKAGNIKVINAQTIAYDTSVDTALAVSFDLANDLLTVAINGRNVPLDAINPTSITDAGTPLSQASGIDFAALVGAWTSTTSTEFWLGDTMALGLRTDYVPLDTDAGLSSIFADTAGGLIVPTPAEWAILLHGPAAEHGTGAWNKGTLSMNWTKLGTGALTDV